MTNLNIRNFPEDLLRALKVEAAERGTTLREVSIDLLSFVLHRGTKVDSAREHKSEAK